MSRLLKTIAIGAMLASGLAVGAVQAEPSQPTSPPSMMDHGMQPHGMMGGGTMGGGEQNTSGNNGGMMNMMRQMSQMAGHCNQMMESHMQQPNSPSQEHNPSG